MAIKLYTNPMSRGRVAHWLLEEIGEPYEKVMLDFKKGEHKSPSYLKINPMGKVPTLEHDGVVVTESAAICVYLADAFPKAKMAPPLGDRKRGEFLRWIFFAASNIEPAMLEKKIGKFPLDKGHLGFGSYEDTMNAIEGLLKSGPYVLGDQFSAADVYLSSSLGYGMMTKAIDERPVFQKYVAQNCDRPAYKRMDEWCRSKS